jgi:hypothetical protein
VGSSVYNNVSANTLNIELKISEKCFINFFSNSRKNLTTFYREFKEGQNQFPFFRSLFEEQQTFLFGAIFDNVDVMSDNLFTAVKFYEIETC